MIGRYKNGKIMYMTPRYHAMRMYKGRLDGTISLGGELKELEIIGDKDNLTEDAKYKFTIVDGKALIY